MEDKKSTLGLAGEGTIDVTEYAADPLELRPQPLSVPAPFSLRDEKRWLGVLWRGDLDFLPQLQSQIRSAKVEMLKLGGLVQAGFPLSVAVVAFEGKVDSKLQHARWLHVMPTIAENTLDAEYSSWARQLLGLPTWASGEVARAELGWRLTGFARSIRAAASRRASLWNDMGLAGQYFRRGHHSPGRTWAKVSLETLTAWDVPDFPLCLDQEGAPVSTEKYKEVVKKLLEARCQTRWRESIQKRTDPLPFVLYLKGPSEVHHDLLAEGAPWDSLTNVRGWCRVRSQGIQLAEMNGVPSKAAGASCIFCGRNIAGAEFHHVLAECPAWAQERAKIIPHQGVNPGPMRASDLLMAILAPGGQRRAAARNFAATIDVAATAHWASKDQWA